MFTNLAAVRKRKAVGVSERARVCIRLGCAYLRDACQPNLSLSLGSWILHVYRTLLFPSLEVELLARSCQGFAETVSSCCVEAMGMVKTSLGCEETKLPRSIGLRVPSTPRHTSHSSRSLTLTCFRTSDRQNELHMYIISCGFKRLMVFSFFCLLSRFQFCLCLWLGFERGRAVGVAAEASAWRLQRLTIATLDMSHRSATVSVRYLTIVFMILSLRFHIHVDVQGV